MPTTKTTKTPAATTHKPAQPVTIRQMPESEESWTAEEIMRSHLSSMNTAQLVELLDSKMTLAQVARILLAQSGKSADGAWVGFAAAANLHNVVTVKG